MRIPFLQNTASLAVVALVTACATSPSSGPPPDLSGTRWTVARLDGRAPLAGDDLTAQFGVDGRIEGDSGCNHFSGPWIQTGDTLRIGELLSTRRACAEEDRQAQESRLLRMLQGTNTVRRAGDGRISLSGSAGTLVLSPLPSVATGAARDTTRRTRRGMYDCDGVALTVVFENDTAAITWSGGHDVLAEQQSGSGYWYASDRNTVRSGRSADTLTWTQDGRPARSCEGLR